MDLHRRYWQTTSLTRVSNINLDQWSCLIKSNFFDVFQSILLYVSWLYQRDFTLFLCLKDLLNLSHKRSLNIPTQNYGCSIISTRTWTFESGDTWKILTYETIHVFWSCRFWSSCNYKVSCKAHANQRLSRMLDQNTIYSFDVDKFFSQSLNSRLKDRLIIVAWNEDRIMWNMRCKNGCVNNLILDLKLILNIILSRIGNRV